MPIPKINIPQMLKPKKRIVGKPIKTSVLIEAEYYGKLKFMVEQIKERFINGVANELYSTNEIVEQIHDSVHDESYQGKMNRLISEFKKKITAQFDHKRMLLLIKSMVSKTDKNQKYRFVKNYGFGIDISKVPEFENYIPFINEAVKRNLTLVKNLRNETMVKLETVLRTQAAQGHSIAYVTKQLVETGQHTKKRAALIARNEIKNITGQLTKKRMQNVGIEKAMWLTAEDGRVRPDHKKHDRKIYTIGVGLKDSDGNYEEPMDKINCFLPDTSISFTSEPLKIYKRFYTGSIVKITDESSVSISVTPNHPILTTRGWIFAKEIKQTDKLIKSLVSYRTNLFNNKINDNHIVINNDIYNFFKVMFVSKRVSGTNVKFHGDITDHKVEIIDFKSCLSNNSKSTLYQEITNKLFSLSHHSETPLFSDSVFGFEFDRNLFSYNRKMSFPNLIGSLLDGHLTPFQFLSFALVSDFDTLFKQSSSDYIPASLKHFRDLVLAYARIIKPDNFGDIKIYSINGKPFVESSVFSVRHENISSNVFNFETVDNIYMCNGIVNHNCRCVAIPVIE
jgi:SPP1 gp7 family putative phage head morphogenesis protein